MTHICHNTNRNGFRSCIRSWLDVGSTVQDPISHAPQVPNADDHGAVIQSFSSI
ncbi:hypothetical protein DACRYDRAFT_23810 [Dacryopinax primogenitus]|uniref:Uncharacterized protein n=1 Tax=Dacryopinax primogenitus (strain DJM 731) TaxID=1858805 RepID=M5G626_DACPD|nr:uncharacterized protein DACRYDRAFT_23810 [Dacryopinax primogenitus]EJT99197.1 hypothetical protein DACRYDRAFT_23810 [Dacryopinax primogenitus]